MKFRPRFIGCVTGILSVLWLTSSLAVSVDISQISDLSFGTVLPGAGVRTADTNLCISGSQPTYQVQILGNGPGGIFALVSGDNTISFQVWWNDSPNTIGNRQLNPGAAQAFNSAASVANCPDGPTANIQLVVPASELNTAITGQYGGSLSIMLSPA